MSIPGATKAAVRGETQPAGTTTQTGGPVPGLELYKPTLAMFNRLKLLIYGPPGVGKTTLAASAQAVPEMCPVLDVNIEGGDLALGDPSIYGALEAPDVTSFENFQKLDIIYKALRDKTIPHKTVILDTLNELAVENLDHVISVKRMAGGKNKDEDDIFLEDYGTMTKQMRRVMRKFRDLDINVICVCHEAPTGKDTGIIGPALTPKFRQSAEAMVDVIAYMFFGKRNPQGDTDADKEIVRKIMTQPKGNYIAKDRSPGGRIGTYMTEPTMAKIMAAIKQAKPSESTAKPIKK